MQFELLEVPITIVLSQGTIAFHRRLPKKKFIGKNCLLPKSMKLTKTKQNQNYCKNSICNMSFRNPNGPKTKIGFEQLKRKFSGVYTT